MAAAGGQPGRAALVGRRGPPGRRCLYPGGAVARRQVCGAADRAGKCRRSGSGTSATSASDADTPVISFHVVMQNVTGYPQTWSEQTITEYPTSNPAGSENFNTKFWGVTAVNPTARIPRATMCAPARRTTRLLGQRWHVAGALEQHHARGLDRLPPGMAGGRRW